MGRSISVQAPRRRLRKIVRRSILVAAVMLSLGYLALPWWLPGPWVASKLETELSRLMNRAVTIESIRFSYARGLEITGLTIHRRDQFGEGALLTARKIQLPLVSFKLLRPANILLYMAGLSKTPSEIMYIDQPECWLIVDERGRWNVADLNDRGGVRLPALTSHVSELTVHLIDSSRSNDESQRKASQVQVLPPFSLTIEPTTGRLSWDSDPLPLSTSSDNTRASTEFHVELNVPTLRSDTVLSGNCSARWTNIDLSRVPDLLLPFPQIEALRGHSSGSIVARIASDLTMSFEVDLVLISAELHWADRGSWRLFEETRLALQGKLDPTSRKFEVTTLTYEVPDTLRITGARSDGPVLSLDLLADVEIDLDLRGEVRSLSVLKQNSTIFRDLIPSDTELAGPCTFDFSILKRRGAEEYHLTVDAKDASVALPERLSLPAGEQKEFSLDLSRDSAGEWSLREFEVEIGGSRLSLAGHWPAPAAAENLTDMLIRWTSQGQGRLSVDTENAAEVFNRVPLLTRLLPKVHMSGPVLLRASFTQGDKTATMEGSLQFADDAELLVADQFHKPPGKALDFNFSTELPEDRLGMFEHVQLDARYGEATLTTTGHGATVVLTSSLPLSQWDLEKHGRGRLETKIRASLELQNLQDAAPLSPKLASLFSDSRRSRSSIEGNCRANIEFNGAIIDQELVARFHVDLDASQLGADIEHLFSKPAEELMRLSLDYAYDGRTKEPRETFGLDATFAAGSARSYVEFYGPVGSGGRGNVREQSHQLEISDLARFVAYWPALSKKLAASEVGGAASVRLQSSNRAGVDHWHGRIDLSRSQFHLPAKPRFSKSKEQPLVISLEGRRRILPGDPRISTFFVDRMLVRAGASSITLKHGRADVRDLNWEDNLAYLLGGGVAEVSPPRIAALEAKVQAGLSLDSLSRFFDAESFGTIRPFDLAGQADVDLAVHYADQVWKLEGTIDATESYVNASPHFLKNSGQSANIRLALTASSGRIDEDSLPRLQSLDLQMAIGDAKATLTGEFDRVADEDESDQPSSSQLNVTVVVPDLANLEEILPDAAGWGLHGSFRGHLHATKPQDTWLLEDAELDFEDVQVVLGDTPASVHGVFELVDDRWQADSFSVRIGETAALGTGQGAWRGGSDAQSMNEIALRSDKIDRDELLTDLREAGEVLAQRISKILGRPLTARDMADALAKHSATLRLDAGRFVWPDDRYHVRHTIDELISELQWRGGEYEWRLRGGYNGGLLHARLAHGADRDSLEYSITDCLPSADVVKRLRFAFPGLRPTGNITFTFARPGPAGSSQADETHPTATGEMIVDGGILHGKAAPAWVTRLFPKLDLAEFKFNRMHDWFAVYPDGRTEHRTLFQGNYYHLYAGGVDHVDGHTSFQIGIDLLGGFDSEYWTSSGSGRIPLFDSTTRLGADGEIVEETVKYVPLDFVKAIVWGTNPIRTAYKALRRRISIEKRDD